MRRVELEESVVDSLGLGSRAMAGIGVAVPEADALPELPSRWTLRRAVKISSSVYRLNGSRLLRMVPVKRVGSCGTMVRDCRKSFSPTSPMSMPSIIILPPCDSRARHNASASDDFPAPVRPTTPTFSLPLMVKLTFLRTGGKSGR